MDDKHELVSLPPELVDEILKNRPVYLAFENMLDYSLNSQRTLGVYFGGLVAAEGFVGSLGPIYIGCMRKI